MAETWEKILWRTEILQPRTQEWSTSPVNFQLFHLQDDPIDTAVVCYGSDSWKKTEEADFKRAWNQIHTCACIIGASRIRDMYQEQNQEHQEQNQEHVLVFWYILFIYRMLWWCSYVWKFASCMYCMPCYKCDWKEAQRDQGTALTLVTMQRRAIRWWILKHREMYPQGLEPKS